MSDKFSKILRIIEKTGDKCIVFEKSTDDAYVVMSLDQYENFLVKDAYIGGLTEDELLNKINTDIALWKTSQKSDEKFEDLTPTSSKPPQSTESETVENKESDSSQDDSNERYYFEPVEKDE